LIIAAVYHFSNALSGRWGWQQVATRFETNKGMLYLRSWKKYKRPSE
jgi:hypothetical protein